MRHHSPALLPPDMAALPPLRLRGRAAPLPSRQDPRRAPPWRGGAAAGSGERDWIRGSCGRGRHRPGRGRTAPRLGDALRGGSGAGGGCGALGRRGGERGRPRAWLHPGTARGARPHPGPGDAVGARRAGPERETRISGGRSGTALPAPRAPAAARPPLGVPGASPAHRPAAPGAAASPGPARAAASQASGASRAEGGVGSLGRPRGCGGMRRGPRGQLRRAPGREGPAGRSRAVSGVTRPPRHACLSSLRRLTAPIAARRVSALGASIS